MIQYQKNEKGNPTPQNEFTVSLNYLTESSIPHFTN
jgi:hypothetical protein